MGYFSSLIVNELLAKILETCNVFNTEYEVVNSNKNKKHSRRKRNKKCQY